MDIVYVNVYGKEVGQPRYSRKDANTGAAVALTAFKMNRTAVLVIRRK